MNAATRYRHYAALRFQRTNCRTANALCAYRRAQMVGVAVSRTAASVLCAIANLHLAGGRSGGERRCIQGMTTIAHYIHFLLTFSSLFNRTVKAIALALIERLEVVTIATTARIGERLALT